MAVPTLDDLDAAGRTILLRVDLNSPLDGNDNLADDSRLAAHVETLEELCADGARVGLLAHQGRPGGPDFIGLRPHADRLDDLVAPSVGYCDATFSREARERLAGLENGEAVLLENTRFYSEEYMEFEPSRAAETHLVERLAPAVDAYVNDAFAAAHRSQPSLVGFPQCLPGFAGRLMAEELDVLGDIASTPTPRVYVFGGAKVADAIDVMEHVLEDGLADRVLTAGLVGNLFLEASGVEIGAPSGRFLDDRVTESQRDRVIELLAGHADRIELPRDVAFISDGKRVEIQVEALPPSPDAPLEDIGQGTVDAYAEILAEAGTAILNGPAGVFEEEPTAHGTEGLFEAVARAEYSVVGGGDTSAAIRRLGIEGFDHVSTGGGAALRLLAGEALPAVEALS